MPGSPSSLTIAQQYITRYGMTTYVVLGNIGLLCNIFIFSRYKHRRISCSLYILTMSICSCIGLNSATIPIIYALDHPNPLSSSLIFCRLQYYSRHVFSQLMRVFFVFACVDRYATSSNRQWIRSLSRYQVAVRVIAIAILFWLLLGLFPTMLYTNEGGTCDAKQGLPDILYTAYVMTFVGVLPLVSFITFGLLMMINLKNVRARVHTLGNSNNVHLFRRRDRDMMRMLLIELTIYIFTTLPNAVTLVYKVSIQNAPINDARRSIESFTYFLTRVFLLYLNNCLSFWIYLSTSRTFRSELHHLLFKRSPVGAQKTTVMDYTQ